MRERTRREDGLLTRIERGDEQAMLLLFESHARPVYAVALRVLRDQAMAEAVTEEVFLEVWRAPERLALMEESLGSWLAVAARNRSVDALRRRQPVGMEPPQFAGTIRLHPQRARLAMLRLPAEERRMLEMAFFDGLTHEEIAEVTGQAPHTVAMRLCDGLQTLREEAAA